MGLAVFESESFAEENTNQRYRLLPHIRSIEPNTGSLEGGAIVTISGGGFMNGVTTLSFGNILQCEVLTQSYSEITCRTAAISGWYNVLLTVCILITNVELFDIPQSSICIIINQEADRQIFYKIINK